jgi:hypothetical protein
MREKINRQHHPDLSSNNIDSRQNYCRTDSHDRINQGTLCTQRPWSERRLKVKTWSNKKNRILPALARRRAKNTTGGKSANPRTRELETERKSREGHEPGQRRLTPSTKSEENHGVRRRGTLALAEENDRTNGTGPAAAAKNNRRRAPTKIEPGGGTRQRASGDPQGRKPGRRLLRGRTPTAQGEKIGTQRLGCGTKQESCET